MITQSNLSTAQITCDYPLSQFSWNETNIILYQKLESDILFNVAIAFASLFITSVNVSVIYWLVNKTRTFVDQMILVDCVANIGGLVAYVCHYGHFTNNAPFCMLVHIIRFSFHFLNRIVPINISTYRYILVCQNQRAERFGKAKLRRTLIFSASLFLILAIASSVVYKDDFRSYMYCIGRMETFHGYLDNIGEEIEVSWWKTGRYVSLPIYHPARLIHVLVLVAYFLMTPLVYAAIFRFRSNQDRSVAGKHPTPPQYKIPCSLYVAMMTRERPDPQN